MTFARIVLAVSALVFLGTGAAFLAAPERLASYVSLELRDALARSDVRAVYGGLEVGLAAFLALAAVWRPLVYPATLALTLIFAGLVLGRIWGMLADGLPPSPGPYLILFEIAGAVAGAVALVALQRGGAS